MKLHDLDLSGDAYKIRLFLSLIGREAMLRPVDSLGREHKAQAFLHMNPRGQIPILGDGELQLDGSHVILVHLARRRTDPVWYPLDPVSQGRIVYWFNYSANEIQNGPASARLIIHFDLPLDRGRTHQRSLEVLRLAGRHLAEHRQLAQGEQPSIADVALYPYLVLALEDDLALDHYPALDAWIARIRALPGYIPMPGLQLDRRQHESRAESLPYRQTGDPGTRQRSRAGRRL